MQNIVNGMAVAQKVGMNFGGVMRGWPITDQRLNFTHVATLFFGAATRDVGGLFALAEEDVKGFDFHFHDSKELEDHRSEINGGTNIVMSVPMNGIGITVCHPHISFQQSSARGLQHRWHHGRCFLPPAK